MLSFSEGDCVDVPTPSGDEATGEVVEIDPRTEGLRPVAHLYVDIEGTRLVVSETDASPHD